MNDRVYHFVPSRFFLYFWAVFDGAVLIFPLFYDFGSTLELVLHVSFGVACFLLSIFQFVLYYEIEIFRGGVSFIFFFRKKQFSWEQINRVKSFRTRNEDRIMMQFETGEDIFKFKVPRRSADGIYTLIRESSGLVAKQDVESEELCATE